ncbi:MAG: hypothetical protein LBV12_03500 [Puniceicoccales bacterium]|jgi:hypothetical protein|nr:hypothetical protein [Puniceicoccales bacterium]
MKNLFNLLFLALVSSVFLAGCTSPPPPPTTPEYEIFCSQGVRLDPDKAGYDSAIGGYWLIGSGNTIRLERHDETAPSANLVLNIQTKPSAQLASNISELRIVTPDNYILRTRFGDESISRTLVGNQSDVQVLRNTGFIKIVRDGNRMKITFSAAFLRQYAPYGMAVTWFDISN